MDAWLPEIRAKDTVGTSLLVANTPVGKQYISLGESKETVTVENIGYEKLLSSQGKERLENKDLPVFIFFRKAVHKKIPEYDLNLPKPTIHNWIRGIIIQFNVIISGSKWPYWLVSLVSSFQRYSLKALGLKSF